MLRAVRSTQRRIGQLENLLPAVPFATGLAVLSLGGSSDRGSPVLLLWTIALLLLLIVKGLPIIVAWLLRRRFPDVYSEETTAVVDDFGLHVRQGDARLDREWAWLTDFVENAEFVVIRRGLTVVLAVPRRAFGDSAGRDAFVSVLRSHLPEGASGRR
jgi:hypothetical protein